MSYSQITKLSILPNSATKLQLTSRFLKGRHRKQQLDYVDERRFERDHQSVVFLITTCSFKKSMYLQKLPG